MIPEGFDAIKVFAVPFGMMTKRRRLDTGDVGDVGENLVQLWASKVRIAPNPVRRDRFGWDFCFQFRRDNATPSLVPLDHVPPELTCMVQVKTTLSRAKSCKIALSNWQRMVVDPFPWFVLCIAVTTTGDVSTVHLVHVDDCWVEKVLRRLRELHSVYREALQTLNFRDMELGEPAP